MLAGNPVSGGGIPNTAKVFRTQVTVPRYKPACLRLFDNVAENSVLSEPSHGRVSELGEKALHLVTSNLGRNQDLYNR